MRPDLSGAVYYDLPDSLADLLFITGTDMIKLIATDMDGTLLDSAKNMPRDFDFVISRLKTMGVTWVIASGRSYATLRQEFWQYLNDLVFICDNGAYVAWHDSIIFLDLMKRDDIAQIINASRKIDCKLLLCGMHGTYHEYFGTEKAEKEINSYYVNQIIVDDLLEVDDDIFKLALYDPAGAETHAYKKLTGEFGNRFNMQTSGLYWMDIMNQGVNKGNALKNIQARLDVTRDETMAFGDYMNDIEMLRESGKSYAMKNGHELVKESAAHITRYTNDEDGVMRTVREELGI